jgi:hypothetical protein
MSRSFELFQLASVRMSQQHVERRSMFDQLWDLFPKHRYEKTAATVRTMCIPIRTRSFIRQVMHSKFNRPDVCLHGLDAQASYIEIACIKSNIRTTTVMVWMLQALIWNCVQLKCDSPDARATPSDALKSGKNFSKFGKPIAQLSIRTPYVSSCHT